ncbi:uncharacterized protein LOC119329834 [Triticum dicoccoides]|uniref:uncharacterized protein LOC119329834 n=1 Tax=Triticum dicoccoides TaxID=85692 RepID=UPI000844AFA0|nr:uncharacterized protein LOC119329834 [Triticum dicoccoides]XP_044426519.1 uncharacterized protein LOC123150752 [Triticum aestivum]XP_044426520.1 uncharacterized protein LOC123150752 [Triticum aestivum]
MALSSTNKFRKQVTLSPMPFLALHPCPPRPVQAQQVLATAPPTPPPYLCAAMATAPPAIPLPDYQVSGAAAAHQRGSVGPFVGVLAAVLLLTAMSCFFGRVCAAHAQGPDEWYDCARLAGRRRCWWWRAPRRPVRPAEEEAKPPRAMPLPEP